MARGLKMRPNLPTVFVGGGPCKKKMNGIWKPDADEILQRTAKILFANKLVHLSVEQEW
jgi:hypothetical protein